MGVRGDCLRCAHRHHFAAGVAAIRAEVDQPVGGTDHIEVVLDHQQRMAGGEQFAQCAQQAGDIVEVQAGGRLVEQKQRAALAAGLVQPLARGFGQEAGEFQALGFAARQGRHRLTEPQIIESDIFQRLQARSNLVIVGKKVQRLVHREVEHIGDRAGGAAPCNRDLQNLGAKAPAVAIGAAQIDVGQKLHLDMLEAVAAAGRAAAVTGIEAEGAGGIAAFA